MAANPKWRRSLVEIHRRRRTTWWKHARTCGFLRKNFRCDALPTLCEQSRANGQWSATRPKATRMVYDHWSPTARWTTMPTTSPWTSPGLQHRGWWRCQRSRTHQSYAGRQQDDYAPKWWRRAKSRGSHRALPDEHPRWSFSEEDAEMEVEDEDNGGQDLEPDPPDDPEEQDEQDDQNSWPDTPVHGMIFRKGHPVAHVLVHHENYEVLLTEISQQLPLRSILGVHYIEPGPFDRPHIGFAALLRSVGDQYEGTTECLTLVDVFIYGRAWEPQEPALHRSIVDLPPLLTRRQLLERIGLEPMCAARRNRCLVKVEGQAVPLQHTGPIFVQHASYIVIRVPPFEDEDFSCAGVSLMQRRSSRIREQPVHLFRLSSLYNRAKIRISDDDDSWMVDKLSALDIEIVADLTAVYEVLSPPRELEVTREPVFIVEGWGDRYQQTTRDDRLILLDIDIRQSSRQNDLYSLRKVIWCHQRVTKTGLLTFLRIHELCLEETFHGCSLHLNHVEITDEAVRSIHDGDYIRVMVFGRDRPWNTLAMLRSYEESDRARRVFQDTSEEPMTNPRSPQQVSQPHTSESCKDGSPGHGAHVARHYDGHATPLILKDVTNTKRDTSSGQDVAEPVTLGKPHVSDLWCVAPVEPVARHQPDLQALYGMTVDKENQREGSGRNVAERKTISIADLEGLRLHEVPINIDQQFAEDFESLCGSQVLCTDFPEEIYELLPSVAREWVERYPSSHGLAQDHTYIYTDGAAHGRLEQEEHKSAAYAAVIFAEDSQGKGRHLVGWKGGFVETDSSHPSYYGALARDAINAEQSAILQALLIVFSRRHKGKHTICFDNQAAGYGADGIWKTNQDSVLAQTIRLLTYMMHQMSIDVNFQHVRAHSNQPQNDIVDQCAKNVNLGKLQSNGMRGGSELLHPDNLHKFILWQGAGHIFPTVCDSKISWVHHEKAAESSGNIKLIPAQQAESVADQEATHQIQLHLASYNVLTLRARNGKGTDADMDAAFMHKASYLAQQVTAHNINIIGIQESRGNQNGVIQHDNIYRLVAKGTEQGTHGCELWFNLSKPIATIENKPYYVETDKITVLFESPTILIARLQIPGLQIIVGSVHAPQSGTSSQYRDDWWKQLEEQLRPRRSQDPVIIMGDFNATLPDKINQHIGDLTCGKTNPNSIYLAQLMDKVEVWAPSTFTECHEGTSATWTHSSGQTSRLDYILVDDMLATHHCHSYPLPELDAGNPIEDHQAVGLSVAWTWTTKYRPVNKKRIDWHAISQRQNADKVRECLANIPNCAWGVDIHDHMQYVQDAIQYQLRQNFETNKKPRMRPYITIWSNKEPAAQQGAVWVLIELFAAKQLRLTSCQLKAALKEDRDTHIAKLADDIGQAGSADIHQALSRLKGTAKQRKRGRPPLPQLIGENGQAQTQEDRAKIWQQRCAQLEVGHVTTVQEIRQRCRRTSYKATEALQEIAVEDIPTVLELEARIRKVRRGKAPGPDGLRSDVCSIAAPELSKLLYPILVKQTLHIEEPIQARGGLLVAAYKGRGRQCEVESFRSLLLSNHLGKCLRGVYRPKLQPYYERSSSKLHFAAKRGGNVSHASHYLRTFHAVAKRQNWSSSSIFVDISSAFYRIIRQFAVNLDTPKEELARIFRIFNIPPSELEHLQHELNDRTALAMADTPERLQMIIRDYFEATWFTVPGSPEIVGTLAGSRPGDTFADLIFSFVFSKILGRITAAFSHHGWKTESPSPPTKSQFPQPCDLKSFPDFVQLTWADDLAVLQKQPSAKELVDRTSLAMGVLCDLCWKHGLEPNFHPGKTEGMLHLRGAHSKAVKKEIFDQEAPEIRIPSTLREEVRLRIVAKYKHLGYVVTTVETPEVRYRLWVCK